MRDITLRVTVRDDVLTDVVKDALAPYAVRVVELVNDGFGHQVPADRPPLTSASNALERERRRKA